MARISKHPDVRRSELIAAAWQLFQLQGYQNTAVSDIVNHVGVAKGTFYYYFSSKTEVLEALVDDLSAQSLALIEPIVADDSLNALEKWRKAFAATSAWKLAHRAELTALLRMLYSPDNVLLQYKMQREAMRAVTPALAKIVEQGVAETVFDTEYVVEAAAIALSMMQTFSDRIAELILQPQRYPQAERLARRKVAAVQTAVERLLGAPQGALPLIDDDTLQAWFAVEAAGTRG